MFNWKNKVINVMYFWVLFFMYYFNVYNKEKYNICCDVEIGSFNDD